MKVVPINPHQHLFAFQLARLHLTSPPPPPPPSTTHTLINTMDLIERDWINLIELSAMLRAGSAVADFSNPPIRLMEHRRNIGKN